MFNSFMKTSRHSRNKAAYYDDYFAVCRLMQRPSASNFHKAIWAAKIISYKGIRLWKGMTKSSNVNDQLRRRISLPYYLPQPQRDSITACPFYIQNGADSLAYYYTKTLIEVMGKSD